MRVLVLVLALASCAPESPDPPPRAETPPAAATDSDRIVTMVEAVEGSTLRFRVRAPADGALYLDNCGGAFAWGLERQVEGEWEPAWAAVINECHSAPIVIAPGEEDTLTGTVAPDPGDTLAADRYRVAVYGLFTAHDRENHMENPRLEGERRASEPFRLGPVSPR